MLEGPHLASQRNYQANLTFQPETSQSLEGKARHDLTGYAP